MRWPVRQVEISKQAIGYRNPEIRVNVCTLDVKSNDQGIGVIDRELQRGSKSQVQDWEGLLLLP